MDQYMFAHDTVGFNREVHIHLNLMFLSRAIPLRAPCEAFMCTYGAFSRYLVVVVFVDISFPSSHRY